MSRPQEVFTPHSDPNNSPIGPKLPKTSWKLDLRYKLEYKETEKIKVASTYE